MSQSLTVSNHIYHRYFRLGKLYALHTHTLSLSHDDVIQIPLEKLAGGHFPFPMEADVLHVGNWKT